jgi:hypothetical protein
MTLNLAQTDERFHNLKSMIEWKRGNYSQIGILEGTYNFDLKKGILNERYNEDRIPNKSQIKNILKSETHDFCENCKEIHHRIERHPIYTDYSIALYHSFDNFKDEINSNIKFTTNLKLYISEINEYLDTELLFAKKRLLHIDCKKVTKDILPQIFVDYLNNIGKPIDTLDNAAISDLCLTFRELNINKKYKPDGTLFMTTPKEGITWKELNAINTFQRQYNYKEDYEENLNTSEIIVEQTTYFLEWLREKFKGQYKPIKPCNCDDCKKLKNEPNAEITLRTFKYNKQKQFIQLGNLLRLMSENESKTKYLDTTLKQFIKIFDNKPIKEIKPINWEQSVFSLCYFFKKFQFQIEDVTLFKIISFCFTHKGKPLTYEILQRNYRESVNKHTKLIDKIFEKCPL